MEQQVRLWLALENTQTHTSHNCSWLPKQSKIARQINRHHLIQLHVLTLTPKKLRCQTVKACGYRFTKSHLHCWYLVPRRAFTAGPEAGDVITGRRECQHSKPSRHRLLFFDDPFFRLTFTIKAPKFTLQTHTISWTGCCFLFFFLIFPQGFLEWTVFAF